jgi:hypothetical protein
MERAKMKGEIPTKWAIIEFGWGTGRAHIYSLEKWEIGFYHTEEDARSAAKKMIQDGDAKQIAVLEVKALLVPKPVDFTEMV